MKLNKNKKIIILIFFIILILIFTILFIIKIKNNKIKNEILPEEEISEEQYRQTKVLLYFINEDTGEIEKENRLIDVKYLIKDPYEIIINMLIEGKKNKKLVSYIPKNTKINKINLEKGILKIDFSEEFLEIKNNKNKNEIINIIEKSLKELIEINFLEITVNNEKIN